MEGAPCICWGKSHGLFLVWFLLGDGHESFGDPTARWVFEADPKTRKVRHVEFCIATDKGLEHPPYEPTPSQLALFRRFAQNER